MSNKPSARRRPGAKPNARPFPTFAVVIAAVLVVGVAFIVAVAGGSDDTSTSTADVPAFGPVAVEGSALPAFDAGGTDPAVGASAPLLEGRSTGDTATTVGRPGQATLVVFLAHWCPHCQAELPLLVDLAQDGEFDDVRTVAVLTGTNPDAPNFPPAAWLEREGWAGDVLLDDDAFTAAKAFGLAGYPFIVALDAEGKVVARSSGELPAEQVIDLVDRALGR